MTTDDEMAERESVAEARLAGLLRDLMTLQTYLDERGRHTYEVAQRFLENARRDAASRAYDERQAAMLEYQHYIWHEIAGRLSQLIIAYGEDGAQERTAEERTAEECTAERRPPASAPAESGEV
ncbi:MAG: hypothetical protein IVW57_06430 [Ktedonobacterales bacterium]|nr:hypothetical protein [Ktedonobacterales bacterium]